MTVYFAAQTLVLSYTKKLKHVEALWFASISNSILWFTYVKACWRAAMSSCGKLPSTLQPKCNYSTCSDEPGLALMPIAMHFFEHTEML